MESDVFSLRSEPLGDIPCAAGDPYLSDERMWDSLRQKRFLFTHSTALLAEGALDSLLLGLGAGMSASASSPAALTFSPLCCQYTSGMLVVTPHGDSWRAPVSSGPVLRATKLGLRDNRILHVASAATATTIAPTSEHAKRLLSGGGSVAAGPSPSSPPFEIVAGKLNTLLTWLRTSLGRLRASITMTAAGAGANAGAAPGESPSVLGLLKFDATASPPCFALYPAPAGSDLLAPPASLRSLLAPAGPAPAPAHPATAYAAVPVGYASGVMASAAAVGSVAGVKRSREAFEHQEASASSSAAASLSQASSKGKGKGVSLAIVVPYRDQPLQNRSLQLKRFAEHMPAYLSSSCISPPLEDYHIIVVEQSDDGQKFNRGKLLNIGYAIATATTTAGSSEGDVPHVIVAGKPEGPPPSAASAGAGASSSSNALAKDPRFERFGITGIPSSFSPTAVCFHDVDLLPKPGPIGRYYAMDPNAAGKVIHIAGAWPRYSAGNDSYVGGITTLSTADFSRINGFPNNFWGWGGEDDELRHRLQVGGLYPPLRPDPALCGGSGSIVDLEEEVVGERASTKLNEGGREAWRCMWRKELRAYHGRTNHLNGLRYLKFKVLKSETGALHPRVTVVTVDVMGDRDVAAQLERQSGSGNNGLQVSESTIRSFIDEMVTRERAPKGSGELKEEYLHDGKRASAAP